MDKPTPKERIIHTLEAIALIKEFVQDPAWGANAVDVSK